MKTSIAYGLFPVIFAALLNMTAQAADDPKVAVRFIVDKNSPATALIEATGVGYYPAGEWDKILRQKQILEHKQTAERVSTLMAYQMLANVMGACREHFDMESVRLSEDNFIEDIRILRSVTRGAAAPAIFVSLGLKVSLTGGITADRLKRDGWSVREGKIVFPADSKPLTRDLYNGLFQDVVISDGEGASFAPAPPARDL